MTSAGAHESSPTWRRYLVMVIDDSAAVRKIVEVTFNRAGMDAISFPDGMAALNALASGTAPIPDILLLDIGMPKMDGYEVAKILRSHSDFTNTPIIMLTGRDGVLDRMRSKLAGARGFVAKPFRPAELVQRVRAYLQDPSASGEVEW